MDEFAQIVQLVAASPGITAPQLRDALRQYGRVSITVADVVRTLRGAPQYFQPSSDVRSANVATAAGHLTGGDRDDTSVGWCLSPVFGDRSAGRPASSTDAEQSRSSQAAIDWSPPPRTHAAVRGLPPLYPWQREALAAWRASWYCGVIEAVTGTGKTFVGLSAACEELARGGQVVVLVPTRELLAQWQREIEPIVLLGTSVGLLGDGRTDGLGSHDVVIAVVNSARDGDLTPRRPGGLLIADECHRYASLENRRALVDAFPHRLGLSATFARPDDGHLAWLVPYFGQTCYRLGYEQARRESVVAPFAVTLVGLSFTPQERAVYDENDDLMAATGAELRSRFQLPVEPAGAFLAAVAALARTDDRGGYVARLYLRAMRERRRVLDDAESKFQLLASLGPDIEAAGRTLVFTSSIDAAERGAVVLGALGQAAAAIHSGLPSAERRALIDRFRAGDLRVLAAPQVLDEGIDVASADLAIVLGASRSRRQMVQRMGRVIRRKPDGRSAKFVVAYVSETIDDPSNGAHELFLEEVTAVAESVETRMSVQDSGRCADVGLDR